MPSTYSNILRLELPATGEQAGLWGTTTNKTLGTLLEAAIAGMSTPVTGTSGTYTLSTVNGATDEARSMGLWFSAALTGNLTVLVPALTKMYFIVNATTGAFTLTLKATGGLDSGIVIPQGSQTVVFCDGNYMRASNYVSPVITGGLTASGLVNLSGATEVTVPTPVNPTDAVPKLYADNIAASGVPTPAWVSGNTYTLGFMVYSPITFITYRHQTATSSSTTDPSQDGTNWFPLGANTSYLSTNRAIRYARRAQAGAN